MFTFVPSGAHKHASVSEDFGDSIQFACSCLNHEFNYQLKLQFKFANYLRSRLNKNIFK